jgi:hypothetical protein
MDAPSPWLRRSAIVFLVLEAFGAHVFWGFLLAEPEARGLFLAPDAPDATLLAFLLPDLILFAGAALFAAVGLLLRRSWAYGALLLHTGAAVYASLYFLSLPFLSGGGWTGAILMVPSLVLLPILASLLRPGRRG